MKKLNNKGLTLVELIIAITMATMVIAAATVFLYNAERSYRISQYSVDLQMEAQVLMEQMSNWVLESNYMKTMNGGKALVLYQVPQEKYAYSSGAVEPITTTVPCQRTIIYERDGKLYIDVDDTTSRDELRNEIKTMPSTFPCLTASASPDPENCIGEHVEFFDVAYPNGVEEENANSIEVKLSLREGGATTQGQSYIVYDVFSFRNAVHVVTPSPTASPVPTTTP